MKIFGDLLTSVNNLDIPVGNLGLSRRVMPQIENPEKFMAALEELEIETSKKQYRLSDLRLTQAEVNKMKVWKIMTAMRRKKGVGSIWITADNYVIDGSHRFVAKLNINRYGKMAATKINKPANELVQLIRANPEKFGVVYRTYAGEKLS